VSVGEGPRATMDGKEQSLTEIEDAASAMDALGPKLQGPRTPTLPWIQKPNLAWARVCGGAANRRFYDVESM